MTGAERGFLLLSSHLGAPDRKILTTAQLRYLGQRVREMENPRQDRELTEEDLLKLGYGREKAGQILRLLEDGEILDYYLSRAKAEGCVPVTRASEDYPQLLHRRLGEDAPGCLWAKGDLSLLNTPAISLVGSRELEEENGKFAEAVGAFAARRGLTLISGNARGADKRAQSACRKAGGSVISIVADELTHHGEKERMLYLSEDGFAEGFSAQRALSRNRCIHAMGHVVFVAQSDLKKGGTWQGTAANLRHSWSPVLCYRDGSEASYALEQLGAYLIGTEQIPEFDLPEQMTIF